MQYQVSRVFVVDDDTVVTAEEALTKTQPADMTNIVSVSFSVNPRPTPTVTGAIGGATSRGPLPQMVATPTTTTTEPTPS